MSCPFPGMDPWLEAPTEWPDVHHALITEIRNALQPELRSHGYYAKISERVLITEPHRPIYPDVSVIRARRPRNGSPSTAVLVPDEPLQVTLAEQEITEGYVEIFRQKDHLLVTAIEVISPTNKSNPQGRELYQQKQRELREAGVHLVEIDFIRRGVPIVDVTETDLQPLPAWDYLIVLGRRGVPYVEIYPLRLRDRLPRCRIPLATDQSQDAVLDLQAAFQRVYDSGPYPERLDYHQPPDPPLSPEDAEWARQILTEKGLL